MLLRKKIILSNILMVALPVVMILIAWAGFVNPDGAAHLRLIRREADGGDALSDVMNVIYTFEAEISDMNWNATFRPGENGTVLRMDPEPERMEELDSLGYHLQMDSADGCAFSNMDDADREVTAQAGTSADGAVIWIGDSLVIKDTFPVSGKTCYLTAVYNAQRADRGVRNSLLPVYTVSPYFIIILLAVSAAGIAGVMILMTRWLSRSIMTPLGELKEGADRIASGDLDHRISYSGRDEFGDVCSEFDHMRLQLKEAVQERKQYEEDRHELLRGISHDLRSPLTSIKGYAMGLKDGIADSEQKRQRYCDAIITRAEDLERLSESLSLFVKLENESGMLEPETVCLDEYIRYFLEEKRPWFSIQNLDVEYRTDAPAAMVKIDIREMQRVFMNLFENTVRYREKDRSRVELSVRERDSEVEIRFHDDGPGVEEQHIPHLFESFYRADESRTNPEKGSGLGLAVAKRILEGQNGTITAYSEDGLCICMVLPLVKEEESDEEDTDR